MCESESFIDVCPNNILSFLEKYFKWDDEDVAGWFFCGLFNGKRELFSEEPNVKQYLVITLIHLNQNPYTLIPLCWLETEQTTKFPPWLKKNPKELRTYYKLHGLKAVML